MPTPPCTTGKRRTWKDTSNPYSTRSSLAYLGPEGLEEFKSLCRSVSPKNPYLDYKVIDLDTGETAYHRKRRVHPREETTNALEDVVNFYEWLREQAELGVEPGVYDPAQRAASRETASPKADSSSSIPL